jgi:hypothetical protein
MIEIDVVPVNFGIKIAIGITQMLLILDIAKKLVMELT